jgi:hypothetical protein
VSSSQLSRLLLPFALVAATACTRNAVPGPQDNTGSLQLSLTDAPADVQCLRVAVQGARLSIRTADLTAGARTRITFVGLPTGTVTLAAEAFSVACAAIDGKAPAPWVGGPLSADLYFGSVTMVTLPMRRNGQARFTVDFDDEDGDGGSEGLPDGDTSDLSGSSDVQTGAGCPLPSTCTNDLGGLGQGDFSIGFHIETTSISGSGVIAQRAVCAHSAFWDIRMSPPALGLELDDDGANYAFVSFVGAVAINDGANHEVRICRRAGQLRGYIDGVAAGGAPNATPVGEGLAPLETRTSVCSTNGFDATETLVGTVSAVCVGALP